MLDEEGFEWRAGEKYVPLEVGSRQAAFGFEMEQLMVKKLKFIFGCSTADQGWSNFTTTNCSFVFHVYIIIAST